MKTVLALRALGLGDFLTALPALRALGEAFRAHRRLLAMPAGLAPLAHVASAADTVVDARPQAALAAAAARADVAVNLHGRGPESHRVLIATRPRRLLAFRHPDVPETDGAPSWRDDEPEAARWCRLLRGCGVAADPGRLDLLPPGAALPVEAPRAARGATLIHPGAASGARRWPVERFAAVARAERIAGRRVIVTGGSGEVALARRVAHAAGLDAEAVYAGRTSLVELAALVDAAARVVCGDTGVAHLATALRTPSVVLFGPTAPSVWGPPPDRPWHRVLWAGRPGDPHGETLDPGLAAITVEHVLAALAEGREVAA
jgi:ADP-heptose:LPS heptosyltransferase